VIYRFFKLAAAAILDFKNFTFLTVETVNRVELHQCAKFRQNRCNGGRDMVFLDFSRWLPPPSWIFVISNFLTVGRVTSDELHHYAEFRRNRSKRGRDI